MILTLLDISLPQDRLDYEFYYGTIMDKATGYPDRWNQAHRGYMTLYKGKPPKHCKLVAPACPEDKDRDFYVTPETEAYAMLIIRGGFDKWEAQFETARTYPGYQQKIYHKAVDQAKIMASEAIKQELYLAQNVGITAETPPPRLACIHANDLGRQPKFRKFKWYLPLLFCMFGLILSRTLPKITLPLIDPQWQLPLPLFGNYQKKW